MSHFIIRSGPKYIPEGQTLSMTSLVPIHQHSAAIFLGQGQDASQPLAQSLFSPQKYATFMLRAPCGVMEVPAVPGQGMQIHPCHSFQPVHLLHEGKGLREHMASAATSPCSHLCPAPVTLQSCPMCHAAAEASAHIGNIILKCRNASECLVWNQNPWILFSFYFVLFKVAEC